MLRSILIGNLGADAEVVNYNGSKFVSFNVADTRRYADENGEQREQTQWVQCSWNQYVEKLLPYLRRGRCVYVEGRGSSRCYSSEKLRRFVSSPIIFVDRVELVGATPSEVPSHLYTGEGVQVEVTPCFHVAFPDGEPSVSTLQSVDGRKFIVSQDGYVSPMPPQDSTNPETDSDSKKDESITTEKAEHE